MPKLDFKLLLSHLGIGLIKQLAHLPYRHVARLGEMIGSALFYLPSSRKHIVLTNLALCFPQLSERERKNLAKDTFRYVIRSFAERGIIWSGSVDRLKALVEIKTPNNFQWHNPDRPRIILSMHTSGMEAGALMISHNSQPKAMSYYMPMSNKTIDAFAFKSRLRFGGVLLPRSDNALPVIKYLKRGFNCIFLVDMDFGRRGAEFVPFFGVPACTITSVARLAKATGAEVIPAACLMKPNYEGYLLEFFEPLAEFGQGDLITDLTRMNQFFESIIKRDPAQYYWVHRRFKTRPLVNGEPMANLYSR